MKNFTKMVGIIALIAIIGFSFASCDNGSTDGSGGGGGSRDPALVGTWTGDWINHVWTFNSDGSGNLGDKDDPSDNERIAWSSSGTTLTITFVEQRNVSRTATYAVSGNTLTFSNAGDTFIFNGTYTKNG